jgi:hypothetical protein
MCEILKHLRAWAASPTSLILRCETAQLIKLRCQPSRASLEGRTDQRRSATTTSPTIASPRSVRIVSRPSERKDKPSASSSLRR